jgi:hypothetical protein
MVDGAERRVGTVRLPEAGRVVPAESVVPWLVLDAAGEPVEPIRRFPAEFVARGNRTGSVRSCAYALHRWWRFLAAVEVGWDKATSAEVRDFVLWLKLAAKPRRTPRTVSATTAGQINPATRKRHPDDAYQPRTIRHSNAVLRSFYDYWIELGAAPLVNPVHRDRATGRRPHGHHNPLEPFAPAGRLRYPADDRRHLADEPPRKCPMGRNPRRHPERLARRHLSAAHQAGVRPSRATGNAAMGRG